MLNHLFVISALLGAGAISLGFVLGAVLARAVFVRAESRLDIARRLQDIGRENRR